MLSINLNKICKNHKKQYSLFCYNSNILLVETYNLYSVLLYFICKIIIINKKCSIEIYKSHCIANNKINYFTIVPYINI